VVFQISIANSNKLQQRQCGEYDYGIIGKSITVRNPQINAIAEIVHYVVGNFI
jgi:hypothetical protein